MTTHSSSPAPYSLLPTPYSLSQKLLTLADDEFILAHRNAEWTGHAPILEEDIAFSNIAQDELGHAIIWYELRQTLTGDDPDQLVYFRDAAAWCNAPIVELPKGDWAFSMLRQYLFDAAEHVRLPALAESTYQPLAQAAAKIQPEELYHYRHTTTWLKRLALGTDESHRRTQAALDALWPHTTQLFIPLPDESELVKAGILPDPTTIHDAWQATVRPFLTDLNLTIPPDDTSAHTRHYHTDHLPPLLSELQSVAHLDPEAKW